MIVLCEVVSENILIYNAVCTGKPYKWSINCVFLFNLDAFFEVQNSSSHIYTVLVYTMPHGIAIGCCSNYRKNHDFCTICFILHCICVKHNVFYVFILNWTIQAYLYRYWVTMHTLHLDIQCTCIYTCFALKYYATGKFSVFSASWHCKLPLFKICLELFCPQDQI